MDSSSNPTVGDHLSSSAQKETKAIDPMEMNNNSNAPNENADNSGGYSETLPKESDPNSLHGLGRPTYMRMSRRHLAPKVLDKYKIDYMIEDNDPDFILIKRYVPEYEQDFLWAATRELREQVELERNKGSQSLGSQPVHQPVEPEIVKVNPGKRGAELDLKINRIPFEKWLEFKGSDKRGKHVLDVAMRPCNPPALVTGNIASKTADLGDSSATDADASSVPVRLAINSTHVSHELSKIADMGIRPGRNVIIPPWKPLVTYHDAIIQRFQTLKRLQSERHATSSKEDTASIGASEKDPVTETSQDQREKNMPKSSDNTGLEPCEICDLAYPPHNTPLECLDIRISHLQCLVDFLDNDLKHVFDLRRDLAAGKISEIAFEDLWHLFSPGDLVVSPKQRQAYRVFHTSGGRPLLSSCINFEKRLVVTPFRIDCFYIDFDQTNLGPVSEVISIGEYSGKRQIALLNADFYRNRYFGRVPVFPVRFVENSKSLIEDLIKRGRRLHQFGTFAYKRFHGSAIIESMPEYEYVDTDERRGRDLVRRRSLVGKVPFTSDIIIDAKREGKYLAMDFVDVQVDWRETAEDCTHYGATRYYDPLEQIPGSNCSCSDIVLDEAVDRSRAARYKEDLYLLNLHDLNDDITDEHFILLRSVIKAFVLQKRAWLNLSVDLIQDLDGENEKSLEMLKKSGLDDLVLPDGYCDLLEALITAQPSTRIQTQFTDPLRGKGQGLIILLHGGTGLGKTSTAECIAAYTQRPLYPIPCNDISLAVDELEKSLDIHLNRAQEWNCIVLIDDVDSLIGTMALTSTVSSFCHALDNYRGTIILTTKTANFACQAVLSRIHVSLHFPTFGQDSTIRVWQKNIDCVRTKGLANLDREAEKAILTFAKAEYARGERWDGRQIRNCFQTAISLAEFDVLKRHPDGKKGAEAKGLLLDRPSLTPNILETAAIAAGKLVHSAEPQCQLERQI